MKGLFLFLCTFAMLSLGAREFVVRYQNLTSGTVFYIETVKGERVGKVVRDTQKEPSPFTFYGKEDQILARGEAVRHKSDTMINVVGQKGEALGGFSAEIFNLYPTEYKIYLPSRQMIARGFMNWLGNSFSLTHADNPKRYLVTFSRPNFKLFNDNWHFDVHEEGVIDFCLLAILGAFQTACDLTFDSL